MSVVHLQAVEILNASAAFADPYIFKITFECISPLTEDLEWKLIYVGSAEDEKYDQELDNCLVGPVPTGTNSFEFEAAAPTPDKIPAEDLLGVTVILLTASYREQEFIRVGYYVNNEYESQEERDNPPEKVDLTRVRREVLVSKPRVTRFNIKWDSTTGAEGEASSTMVPLAGEVPMGDSMGGSGAASSSSATVASSAVVREEEARPEEDERDDGGVAAGGAGAAGGAKGQASSFKPVSVA